MLDLVDLSASHGAVAAVRSVSLHLRPAEVLAIVGPNGAGKSTLAHSVAGLHKQRSGQILLQGTDLSRATTTTVARSGIALVPQGRRLFGSCTVAEHVKISAIRARSGAMSIEQLLSIFPTLYERWSVRARQLSGGEQQMLAITRAALLGPHVLVLDEPTEGLAPSIVSSVATLIRQLQTNGVATLLMEQHGAFPFTVADRVLGMDRGEISEPNELADTPLGGVPIGQGGGTAASGNEGVST